MNPLFAIFFAVATIALALVLRRTMQPRVRAWLWVLAAVFAMSALTACQPLPRSIPPGLEAWAKKKAQRLAWCVSQGARGQEIVRCLADYSPDRGTWACERAARAVTEQRSVP